MFGKRSNSITDDWLNEQRRRLGLPDLALPDASPVDQPVQAPQKQGGGFGANFLGGGSWGDRLSNLGNALAAAGAYSSGEWGAGAEIAGARNHARDAAIAAQQKRQADWEDYQRQRQFDADLKRQEPRDPHYFQDNAGNQWQTGPDGKPQLVMRDPTQKMYIQGDQAIPITNGIGADGNPIAQAPANNLDAMPTVEEGHQYTPGPGGRANPNNWKALGGGVGNGTGGFQLYPYRQ